MYLEILRRSIHDNARADYSRSGGPGGQNVNKVNTKVTLRIKLEDLEGLNEAESARLRECITSRITKESEIVIAASEERSLKINLERAYARMETMIINAARLPRLRRPTKPSRAAREERLNSKHHRGRTKARRQFKNDE